MKKYFLIAILAAAPSTPLFASSTWVGGGSTCTPRAITCNDGSTVVSSWCGSDDEAKLHSCPVGF